MLWLVQYYPRYFKSISRLLPYYLVPWNAKDNEYGFQQCCDMAISTKYLLLSIIILYSFIRMLEWSSKYFHPL